MKNRLAETEIAAREAEEKVLKLKEEFAEECKNFGMIKMFTMPKLNDICRVAAKSSSYAINSYYRNPIEKCFISKRVRRGFKRPEEAQIFDSLYDIYGTVIPAEKLGFMVDTLIICADDNISKK